MRKQANSEDCFVCGLLNPSGLKLSFHEHPDGTVRSILMIRPDYQGWPGIVHGGIIATLLDEVTARVYMNDSTDNRLMVTGKLEIRYRKPVPIGEMIEVIGIPLGESGRTATARGELRDSHGRLLAEATTTMVQAPEELIKQLDLDSRKWVHVPDEGEK